MPLSTSSSSSRVEPFPARLSWSSTWFPAILFLFLGICGWEGYWRLKGFVPNITDDWQIWSDTRRRVNHSAGAIALVGASRMMLGIDPAIMSAQLHRPVYMLAIDGSDPLIVLDNLASDDNFKAMVVCSLTPYFLAGKSRSDLDRSAKWVRKYERQSIASIFESRLRQTLQGHLVFRSSSLAPDKLWRKWLAEKPIVPPYAPMRPDRYRPADYGKINLKSLRAARFHRTRQLYQQLELLNEEEFLMRIEALNRSVAAIRARGADVVFVRMPSCSVPRKIEAQIVPRARYWDVFAENITAATYHFEDYRILQGSRCMEGSHLQYQDAVHFTRAFAQLLMQ